MFRREGDGWRVTYEGLSEHLKDMDGMNMKILINSPVMGSWGDKTKKLIDGFKGFNKDRFATIKRDQLAWLKQRDAAKSTTEKSKLTEARIHQLQDLVWQN